MIDSHIQFKTSNGNEAPVRSEDLGELQQGVLLPELEDALDMSGVDQAILVQTRCSVDENKFLLQQAKSSDGLITATVGWAPLSSSDLRITLDQFAHEPLLKGVREIIQDTPNEQFLDNPDFDHGLREISHRDLAFDLLVSHSQLASTIAFADKHPNQRMALNHCGNPPISNLGLNDRASRIWARNIRELARRPHIYCKLSGLTTGLHASKSRWHAETLKPYADTVLKAFGPERIMFGSNWPASTLSTSYPTWLNAVDDLILALSDDEKSAIHSGTAELFYKI